LPAPRRGLEVAVSVTVEPIALPPVAAAAYLGISKRSLYRLIADGLVTARKDGPRTLVDVASLRSYYASLPTMVGGAIPLSCSPVRR
jgi:excisionase family DNA binding protein